MADKYGFDLQAAAAAVTWREVELAVKVLAQV
jgi:hypothetical protein